MIRLLLFVVVALVLVALLVWWAGRAASVPKGPKAWKVVHEEVSDGTEVWLIGPGQPEFIGRALRKGESYKYTEQLLDADAAAEEKAGEWNAALRVSRRRLK